jgi:hypothetical protein
MVFMAQFTFSSAVLIVLALVVQNDGPFRPQALGLGGAVLLTGTLMSMRVHYASHEDLQLVRVDLPGNGCANTSHRRDRTYRR